MITDLAMIIEPAKNLAPKHPDHHIHTRNNNGNIARAHHFTHMKLEIYMTPPVKSVPLPNSSFRA